MNADPWVRASAILLELQRTPLRPSLHPISCPCRPSKPSTSPLTENSIFDAWCCPPEKSNGIMGSLLSPRLVGWCAHAQRILPQIRHNPSIIVWRSQWLFFFDRHHSKHHPVRSTWPRPPPWRASTRGSPGTSPPIRQGVHEVERLSTSPAGRLGAHHHQVEPDSVDPFRALPSFRPFFFETRQDAENSVTVPGVATHSGSRLPANCREIPLGCHRSPLQPS